jgi:DNA sulfur modification protein DndD
MKLRSMTVENFRQFHGRCSLHFSTSEDKNVTVFYGANGAGKTTLLNAFTWCLFGEFTPAFENSTHLLNERAWNEVKSGMEVSCKVSAEFDHEDRKYLVERITIHKKTASGEPQVLRDADLTLDITDETGRTTRGKTAADTINQILPARLSSFFFFDGERIENLVKPDAYKEIEDAIKTILGLEVVERAIKHLGAASKKLEAELREVATPETQKFIDEKQDLEKSREAKSQEKEKCGKNLEALKKEQDLIESKLRNLEEAKKLQEKRDRLVKEFTENQESIAAVRKEIARRSSHQGYLAFTKGLFEGVIATLESHREKGEIPSPIKRQFVEDLLERGECICGTALREGTEPLQKVMSWKERAGLADVEEAWTRLCAQAEESQRIRDELFRFLQERGGTLAKLTATQTFLREQINEVGDALGATESEEVRNLEDRRNKIVQEADDHKKVIWSVDHDIEGLEEKIKEKENQIQASQAQEMQEKKAKLRVQVARKAREVFEQILRLRTDDVRLQLDERIKKTYSKISYKAYIPTLNEQFHLELVKAVGLEDEAVAKGTGENQILSLSFVGALADLARQRLSEAKEGGRAGHSIGFQGGIYPIVMDSPFGSLDENYRDQVAAAIPLLAPQVIVFVTKSQGLGAVRERFASRIGRECVITYFTHKADATEEDIALDARGYPYIRRSQNAFEWASLTEVTGGKR